MPEQSHSSDIPEPSSPLTPETPPDSPDAGVLPAAADNPAAGHTIEMLNQILARLERMEGGLSEHEQWLRRMEEEQQSGASKTQTGQSDEELQRLVGSLTLERDRAIKSLNEAQQQLGQYQQELAGLRKQTAELQAQLAERDREIAQLTSTSAKGLERARTVQTEAQRALQAQQQQLEQLQARVTAAQAHIEQRDRRIAQLQTALEHASARFETLTTELKANGSDPTAGLADRAWAQFARVALVATFLCALVSVGLTGWLHQHNLAGKLHVASTTLFLPGIDARTLATCAAAARREQGIEVIGDSKRGTIVLTHRGPDPAQVKARLDALATELLAGISAPAYVSTPQPASQPAAVALTSRIAQADAQLAELAGTESPPDAANAVTLAAQWQALADERASIGEKLTQLRDQLASAQSQPAGVDVTADQITRAQAADPHLRSESEALQQREEQLAARLRATIDTAGLQFQSLQQALTEADAQLQKDLQDNHPADVNDQLVAIRESLKTWARAVTDLDTEWKRQRSLMSQPGEIDLLAIQAALEKSARAFVTDITAASAAFVSALEAIGQGQDQTTKRLVLRNTLTKQLTPATTAQQTVTAAVRSAVLADNVELTAIVQRYDSLRKQVQHRKSQIAAAVRQARTSELQKQQALHLARLRKEEQELSSRAAQIDAQLLELGRQATQAAAVHAEHARRLANRAELVGHQASDLKSLLGLHEEYARRVAALPAPPTPSYTPPALLAGESTGPGFASAVLLGAAPVLICAAVLAMCWLIISSRRSHQTIEEYARTLKETARRASLAADEPRA